jgi:predicted HTH transcriptional regulator
MRLPTLPANLSDWSIKILNKVIKIPSIEYETFDFKGQDLGQLDQILCAMANTSGGIVFLGIGEKRNGKHLIEFKKEPFKKEEGDELKNNIGTYMHKVDPVPNVTIRDLKEPDESFSKESFYMILKVEPVIKNRPYMLGSSQCYIRVGPTSQPASRSTIIALCKLTIDRSTAVTNLESTAGILKRQLEHIREQATHMRNTQESPFFLPVMTYLFSNKPGRIACGS